MNVDAPGTRPPATSRSPAGGRPSSPRCRRSAPSRSSLPSRPSPRPCRADRAYEKVSPADKNGNDIQNGFDKAAADGNAATYTSFAAFGESPGRPA